ncbi:hypothetical protein CDAR_243541 [Caerostris darwini]|uniref:Uncharacterized protein n=1 Tax=Caerostris darwini TaxID=1538125 RepID=A0AAV4VDG5_9ARAC|nr:hypothetical protein CDAR_243541 [Caerostris darwini]
MKIERDKSGDSSAPDRTGSFRKHFSSSSCGENKQTKFEIREKQQIADFRRSYKCRLRLPDGATVVPSARNSFGFAISFRYGFPRYGPLIAIASTPPPPPHTLLKRIRLFCALSSSDLGAKEKPQNGERGCS